LEKSAYFRSNYLHPQIDIDDETINLKEVRQSILDLDSQAPYDKYKNLSIDEFLQKYPMFRRTGPEDNKVYFKNNEQVITDDIIVPETVVLVINPGSKLIFRKKASLIIFGEIISTGLADDPIVFKSKGKKSWGVLLINGSRASGRFEHCIFDNGGDRFLLGYNYTGALTADHANKLEVNFCEFKNNTGDDALNCKSTKCKIINSVFENNFADAIDFDLVRNGVIANNLFKNNGNDSIDVSLDKSRIYENEIISSGDKGISVGENSNSIIFENSIKDCNIGIEVKDHSRPEIKNNTFEKNNLAINAYRKKRAFDLGGQVEAENCVFINNKQQIQADPYSSIKLYTTN